ncbi:ataxin-7-like [Ostrinia furnacalis]|uniref:ataxin-7-like n=1 Tax=Ostrinia furnacalis TaxID=93504 RepID=UPI00103A9A22|nr:ataxin-7-like [Ostrinia furnacalis]
MSGEFPFAAKIVSPVKCNEKPWDLWVSEIGHLSPRRDEEAAAPEPKGGASRRLDAAPYKPARYRRAGINRLKRDTMSLHGLFPQMDSLNAAVCHMCGVTVKCSAAYRHLLDSHSGAEPILPPPPPVTTVKSRSRHKKEAPPPIPVDLHPVKMETSPVHTATAPISRVVLPQPEMQYLEEAGPSSGVTGEVQVCVESGELPVVSIQDTEDLPLGENITDDIITIMKFEGISSADDIANSTDWKNIMQDISNMSDINFPHTTEPVLPQDLYPTVHPSTLSAYTIPETDLSNIQFANTSPMLPPVVEPVVSAPPPKPTPTTPSTKSTSRSKTSKTKFNLREYDPNKHCGVVTAENPKPCTRSLTCKAHALSLRRTVEGRAKPFDQLLAEHRASRDAAAAPPPPPPVLHPPPPPLLVSAPIDLGFNGFTEQQQVEHIYESLLADPTAALPDTTGITSLLSQPLPDQFLMPDDAELPAEMPAPVPAASPEPPPDEAPPPLVPGDVCWYAACPRPLALCTFNASHAGGAVTLGKKFATVRSNIKSSLSRSCKAPASNSYYYNQNALSLKTVHMNASKTNKPEVRKLIVTCSNGGGKVQQALSELFGPEVRHALNGHAGLGERRRAKARRAPAPVLDLGFSLDVLADEKC